MIFPSAESVSLRLPRPFPWLIAAIAFASLVIAMAFAFYFVFSRIASLDEGYLMITIKEFLEGNPLYDSVFTQYGPFYYLYEWFLRGALHVPLTHNATRLLCIFHWIAASAILGIAARKITKSMAVGLFMFMQAVVHLQQLGNEPGHPQEIVALLLALGVMAAMREGTKVGAWEVLAVITAVLFFAKINIGVFFGFSVLLTIRCHAADRFARITNWLLLAFCAAVPFIIMRHHITMYWARNYSILAACTLFATFVVAWRFSEKCHVGITRYFKTSAFFIVPSLLLVASALLTGSSVHGLLDGLVLVPLKLPTAAVLVITVRNAVLISAAMSVIVATLAVWKSTSARMRVVLFVLKLGYGIAGAFWLVGEPTRQFGYLLPWVWLALVPAGNGQARTSGPTFARVFLCLAAAGQALQAYPIAGTQITLGTFLLVLSYALCLADTLKGVCAVSAVQQQLARIKPSTVRLAGVLGAVTLLCIFANIWCRLPALRKFYANLSPLNLPGSRLIHLPPGESALYEDLVAYLATESDTFISYPCINSLYLWSGKQPPTHLNCTVWVLFTHSQQEKILAAVRQARRPRIVLVTDAVRELQRERTSRDQIAPLIRCVSEDCEEVRRFGPVSIMAPK